MAAFTTTAVERFIKSGVRMGKPHASLRNGRGLCLRLLPTGAASWQFVYRLRGAGRSSTQKTVTIGAWPALDRDRERRKWAGKAGLQGSRREGPESAP